MYISTENVLNDYGKNHRIHQAVPNRVAKAKAKLQFCFCFCFCKIPSLVVAKLSFCKTAVLQIAKLHLSFARMQN
jgi:hypothetical protein